MDLDEWYDLVQEPLPSNPPDRPWREWAAAAGGLLVLTAVVVLAVTGRGGDGASDLETTGTSLPSLTTTSTRRTTTTSASTSTTGSTTTQPEAAVLPQAFERPPPPASDPGPAPAPPPAPVPPPPPPPSAPPSTAPPAPSTTTPPPAPPQPAPETSGTLRVEVRLSRTDPDARRTMHVTVDYDDSNGTLDRIDVTWGDGLAAGHDAVPDCPVAGSPAPQEDGSHEFAHAYAEPGRYTMRVLVATDDCSGGRHEAVVTAEVLVRG